MGAEVFKSRCVFGLVVEVSERSGLDGGEGALSRLRGGDTGTVIRCTAAGEHRVVIL
jgi:hypothetical protein